MNDNTRNRIFLEANNLAKQEYAIAYVELPQRVQETLFCIAKRTVDAEIQEEINNVGGRSANVPNL